MKTRIEIICDKKYQYFYDTNIRSWIVYEIDENGYQISDGDYFSNKTQMIKCYNFKLTTKRGATR